MQRIQIRDARDNGRFFLDNELVDVYGKQIGVYGIAVYTTLARYANHTSQECFPSYNTIGEALDISRNTVIAAVKKLEDAGLIGIEKRISAEKGNPTTTNIYTLLAVKKVTVDKQYPSAPDAPGGIPQVLPSAGDEPGLVQEMNHPSAPEVPELNESNRTNSNPTNLTMKKGLTPTAYKPVDGEKAELLKKIRTLIPGPSNQFISGATNSKLHSITDNYPHAWIQEAFDITALAGRNLGYLTAILDHWKKHEHHCKCGNPTAEKPISIQGYQNQKTQYELDRDAGLARWAAQQRAAAEAENAPSLIAHIS